MTQRTIFVDILYFGMYMYVLEESKFSASPFQRYLTLMKKRGISHFPLSNHIYLRPGMWYVIFLGFNPSYKEDWV
jgi:hypothetical protein